MKDKELKPCLTLEQIREVIENMHGYEIDSYCARSKCFSDFVCRKCLMAEFEKKAGENDEIEP